MYKELIKYIEESLEKDVSKEEIRALLVKHGGWGYDDVKEAFKMLQMKKKDQKKDLAFESGIKTKNIPIAEKPGQIEIPPTPVVKQIEQKNVSIEIHAPAEVLKIEEHKEPLELPAPKNFDVQTKILPGIGELFSKTFEVYKKRFVVLLSLLLIPIILFFSFLYIPIEVFEKHLSFLVFLMFLSFFFSLVVLSSWIQALKNEKLGILDSYVEGFSKVLSLWWIMLLTSFLVIGGNILFLIPGLLFSIWFSFAPFVMAKEGLRGMNAIERSRDYFRGITMQIILRMFVGAIFFYIISALGDLLFEYTHIILASTFAFISAPLPIIYSYVLYDSVFKLKGGEKYTPRTKIKISRFVISLSGYTVGLLMMWLFFSFMASFFKEINIEDLKNNLERDNFPSSFSGDNFEQINFDEVESGIFSNSI